MTTKDILTKPELQFWIPIIGMIIPVVLSYGLLSTKIAVLETKMDNILALLEVHDSREEKLVANVNDLNKRLITLEAIYNRNN